MSSLKTAISPQSARFNSNTFSTATSAFKWYDQENGVYLSHQDDAWLYRTVDLTPLKWEDNQQRLAAAHQLNGILTDVGQMSKESPTGLAALASNREVHILSITWEDTITPPDENEQPLKDFQNEAFNFSVPHRLLAVGIRLEQQAIQDMAKEKLKKAGFINGIKDVFKEAAEENVPSLDKYEDDIHVLNARLSRHGARKATKEERDQIESWFNSGKGTDVPITRHRDYLEVHDSAWENVYGAPRNLEISALNEFTSSSLQAPDQLWAMEALTHEGDAPIAISIRGELERPTATRSRARTSQRKMQSNIEEQQKAGDLENEKDSETFALAKELESYLQAESSAMLTRCSFLFAREITPASETYMDFLEATYGIKIKPLPLRQLQGLEEFTPCSSRRLNDFLQDVNIPQIANCGLQSFSELGDEKGAFMGLINPEYAPFYIDPTAASRRNLPPVWGIFGDPGSGKTFLAQNFATQSVLQGLPVFFINPKGGNSLYGMVEYINTSAPGADATRTSMSDLEQEPGAWDPFRFAATTGRAAEIAAAHINAAISTIEQDDQLRLSLESGLKEGAKQGAQCVMDALHRGIEDGPEKERILSLVEKQVNASPLFALGVGRRRQPRLSREATLNLIDFDREIGLPPPNKTPSEYSPNEKIAVSVITLVCLAAIEILIQNKGGVLLVDEAWTFLQRPEANAIIERIAREGRSLNILLVLMTQKIKDVVSGDMENYLSRVMVLKLNENREAKAALRICGLRATSERLEWLKQIGPEGPSPQYPGGKWAEGIFRDLDRRHSAVALGPTPQSAMEAWTTNPEEVKRREEERKRREMDAGIRKAHPLEVGDAPEIENDLAEDKNALYSEEQVEAAMRKMAMLGSNGQSILTAGVTDSDLDWGNF